MSVITTLRIKKLFFEKIKSNEKKVEYRKNTSYYQSLFKKNPTHLKLHYQQRAYLIKKIARIELINNIYPVDQRPDHLNTPKVFAIYFQ